MIDNYKSNKKICFFLFNRFGLRMIDHIGQQPLPPTK